MACECWKWHVRKSQLNQSKEHIGSKGDEAAIACLLFTILFILLIFVFLVVLFRYVAVGSAIRSDKLQLDRCLDEMKEEKQRCLDESKKEKGRHDKLLKEANEKHNK